MGLTVMLIASGIRVTSLRTSAMAPETRSQEARKLEDSLEQVSKEHAHKHEQVM